MNDSWLRSLARDWSSGRPLGIIFHLGFLFAFTATHRLTLYFTMPCHRTAPSIRFHPQLWQCYSRKLVSRLNNFITVREDCICSCSFTVVSVEMPRCSFLAVLRYRLSSSNSTRLKLYKEDAQNATRVIGISIQKSADFNKYKLRASQKHTTWYSRDNKSPVLCSLIRSTTGFRTAGTDPSSWLAASRTARIYFTSH